MNLVRKQKVRAIDKWNEIVSPIAVKRQKKGYIQTKPQYMFNQMFC